MIPLDIVMESRAAKKFRREPRTERIALLQTLGAGRSDTGRMLVVKLEMIFLGRQSCQAC